jgi:hypothetical protein
VAQRAPFDRRDSRREALEAPALSVFETEMYVGGDLVVGALTDRDEYLTVKGKRRVGDKSATPVRRSSVTTRGRRSRTD